MLRAILPLALFFTLSRRMVLARAVKFTYGAAGGVLRLPYSLATIAKRRPKWEHATTMPVAGIDALCGQSILFCLQRSVTDAKDEEVPGLWLQALHVAQVLSDRLLQDLALVEQHLEWWSRQFQRGTSHWSHFRFMLLGRGPISFLIDVSRLIVGCTKPIRRAFRAACSHSLAYRGSKSRHLRGRRLPAESVLESNHEDPEGGSDEERAETDISQPARMSATDKMQQRMLVLQSIRTMLAEAVAQVHATGIALRLGTNTGGGISGACNPLRGNRATSATPECEQGMPPLSTLHPSPFGVASLVSERGTAPGGEDVPNFIVMARQMVETAVSDMQSIVLELESQVTQLTSDGSSRVQLNRTHSPRNPLPLRSYSLRPPSRDPSNDTTKVQRSSNSETAAAFAPRPRLPQDTPSQQPHQHHQPPSPQQPFSPQHAQHAQHTTQQHSPQQQQHTPHRYDGHHPRTIAEEGSGESEDGEGADLDALGPLATEDRMVQVQANLRALQKMLCIAPPGSLSSTSPSPFQPDILVPTHAAQGPTANSERYPPNPMYRPASMGRVPSQRQQQQQQQPGGLERARSMAGGVGRSGGVGCGQRLRLPTARQVLDSARRQAALAGHLVVIPRWAQMPSKLQRHWLRYMLSTALLAYASSIVYQHSTFAGSDDIQRWVHKAVKATTNSWKAHVVQPLLTVRDELTRTFRERPSIVSPEEFEADKQSLLRMLDDFQADLPASSRSAAQRLPASASGGLTSSSGGSAPSSGSQTTSSSAPSSSSHASSSSGSEGGGAKGTTTAGSTVGGAGVGTASHKAEGSTAGSSGQGKPHGSSSSSNSSNNTSGSGPKGGAGGGSGGEVTASAGDMMSFSPEDQDAVLAGMKEVMQSYEYEMRHPLRNLLMGQLVRSLLIQVQRLKLDTEAAMLELDQILRANELSISLVAAVPALAISWGLLVGLYRWLQPRAPDAKRAAVPCRMALVDLERSLAHALEVEEAEAAGGAYAALPGDAIGGTAASVPAWGRMGSMCRQADVSAAPAAPPTRPIVSEAHGLVVFQVHRVHQEAMELFRSADRSSRFSEWPALSADLAQMAGATSTAQRARVHERMTHSYKVFQR